MPLLISVNGPLLNLCENENSPDVVLLAVQCLEACTIFFKEYNDKTCMQLCIDVFMCYLMKNNLNFDSLFYAKVNFILFRSFSKFVNMVSNQEWD